MTRQLSGGTATVAMGHDGSIPSFRERGLHSSWGVADYVLPSLMMPPEPFQRLLCAIGPYWVTSHE